LHGYAITSLIRRQSDEALLVEEGTLYPALWRLESKGLVDAEWGLSENNRTNHVLVAELQFEIPVCTA
jgi:PadR family transcriptional regulator PadR